MIVIRRVLFFSVCTFLVSSCFTTKKIEAECILDKENNIIKGNSNDAKTFYKKKYFLPRAIESFLKVGKKPQIEYSDFSRQSPRENKFARYHIYGCKDTTWAKEAMAYHLMDKYHINRYDSTHYDTVYAINVIDESKLEYNSNKDCHFEVAFGAVYNDVVVTELRCVNYGFLCGSILLLGMKRNTNSIEINDREGNFNIRIPAYLYRDQGLEAYKKYLNDELGFDLSIVRVDTINIGVYEYRK